MEASEALQIIRDRIVSQFAPEQIVLFGSRASGVGNVDSDLDLLVIFRHLVDKRATRVSLYNSLRGIPFPKDVFVVSQDEVAAGKMGDIEQAALHEGIRIYDVGGRE